MVLHLYLVSAQSTTIFNSICNDIILIKIKLQGHYSGFSEKPMHSYKGRSIPATTVKYFCQNCRSIMYYFIYGQDSDEKMM